MAEKRIVEFKVTPTKNYFAQNEPLEFRICATIETSKPDEMDELKVRAWIGEELIGDTLMLFDTSKYNRKSGCVTVDSFTPEWYGLEPGTYTVKFEAELDDGVDRATTTTTITVVSTPAWPEIKEVYVKTVRHRVRYGESARLRITVKFSGKIIQRCVGEKVYVKITRKDEWVAYYAIKESDVGKDTLVFDVEFEPPESDGYRVYVGFPDISGRIEWKGPYYAYISVEKPEEERPPREEEPREEEEERREREEGEEREEEEGVVRPRPRIVSAELYFVERVGGEEVKTYEATVGVGEEVAMVLAVRFSRELEESGRLVADVYVNDRKVDSLKLVADAGRDTAYYGIKLRFDEPGTYKVRVYVDWEGP